MVFDFYLGHSGHHQRLYSPKCDFAESSMARRAVQGHWLRSLLPAQQQPQGPGQRQHINNASQCKLDLVFLPGGSYSSCSWRGKHDPSLSPDHLPSLVWHYSGPTVDLFCPCHVRLGDASPSHPAFASATPSPLSAASASLPITLGLVFVFF